MYNISYISRDICETLLHTHNKHMAIKSQTSIKR